MTELLPPRTAAQYPPSSKPYTLLISVDDLLVTSTWDVRAFASSFWVRRFTLDSIAPTRLEDGQTTWSGLFLGLYLPILWGCGFHDAVFLCESSWSLYCRCCTDLPLIRPRCPYWINLTVITFTSNIVFSGNILDLRTEKLSRCVTWTLYRIFPWSLYFTGFILSKSRPVQSYPTRYTSRTCCHASRKRCDNPWLERWPQGQWACCDDPIFRMYVPSYIDLSSSTRLSSDTL